MLCVYLSEEVERGCAVLRSARESASLVQISRLKMSYENEQIFLIISDHSQEASYRVKLLAVYLYVMVQLLFSPSLLPSL